MSNYLHARFLPADPTTLRPEDLPVLPAWYPLPPKDETGQALPPHTPEERNHLRHARAVAEACEGPHDGRREQVRVSESGAPPAEVVLYDGLVVYVRDDAASTKHQVAYRYSPQLSPVHGKSMRAVQDGFNEYGKDYAQEAQHDDPSALYADRR